MHRDHTESGGGRLPGFSDGPVDWRSRFQKRFQEEGRKDKQRPRWAGTGGDSKIPRNNATLQTPLIARMKIGRHKNDAERDALVELDVV